MSIVNQAGEFVGNRPVPRSISIQNIGVTPAEVLPNSPIIVASGNGSLRIPAPLGHDLCLRYENTSADGRTPTNAAKNTHTQNGELEVTSALTKLSEPQSNKVGLTNGLGGCIDASVVIHGLKHRKTRLV